MYELPDEDHIIKFYEFHFDGIEAPVIIEAYNSFSARETLKRVIYTDLAPEYGLSKVIDEKVITPVEGVSFRILKGGKYLWAGKDNSESGWMEENEYYQKFNITKKTTEIKL